MMAESLVGLLIFLLVVCVIAAVVIWLIDSLPIDPRLKAIVRVVIILVILIVVLSRFARYVLP